jgi:hypothetical protein
MAALSIGLFLCATQAHAEELTRPVDAGLGLLGLHAFHVSGGSGSFVATDQGLALGLQPYGEWRLSTLAAVGLAVPLTINAPGATSNAYDVGFTPRLRIGYAARDWLYPFILGEAGPAWSHQHPGAWIFGAHVSIQAGARMSISDSFAIFAELGYDYTSFSGDFAQYYATNGPAAPIVHGKVATSYGGAGIGVEFNF